jgi:hypothetical protein
MIMNEDRSAPGIDMHCIGVKVSELANGNRHLTITLQGEYNDEALKEAVVTRLNQDIRFYAGDFEQAVIAAMRSSVLRLGQELQQLQRELAQEKDLHNQETRKVVMYETPTERVCRLCLIPLHGNGTHTFCSRACFDRWDARNKAWAYQPPA